MASNNSQAATSHSHGRTPSIPAIAIQPDDADADDDDNNSASRDADASPMANSLTLSTASTPPPSTPPLGSPIGLAPNLFSSDGSNSPSTPHPPGLGGTFLTAQQPGKPHGSYSQGLDVPRAYSPAPSDGYTSTVPPSPTISERSYQPQTSVSLRDNDPTSTDGLTSLNLLRAEDGRKHGGHGQGHMRKTSFASTVGSADGTEPDHTGPTLQVPTANEYGRDRSHSAASDGDAFSRRTSITIAGSSGKPERSDSKDSGPASPSGAAKLLNSGVGGVSRANTASSKPGANAENVDADSESRKQELDPALDAELDTSPFDKTHAPFQLASLVDPKNLPKLTELGGTEGVLKALGTDPRKGLRVEAPPSPSRKSTSSLPGLLRVVSRGQDKPTDVEKGELSEKEAARATSSSPTSPIVHGVALSGEDDDPEGKPPSYQATMEDRQRVYGKNVLPGKKSKSLLELMWIALKDKVLILLSIAAVVSLALGLFQDFGTPPQTFSCGPGLTCTEPPVDWVEGVAIMVAVAIVVIVGSVNDWQKEKQFKALNEKKDDRTVKVIRGGSETVVNIKDVVVGDIALLEPGEVVPCDGIFLTGHNVRCDESGATGESDAIKKMAYDECISKEASGELGGHTDCFIVSGSKVLEGVGSYVVIAVGTKSFNGRIMMALRGDTENTPLQMKLNDLAELIAKLGAAAGLILFSSLMIRFFVQLGTNDPVRTANQKGLAFVQILIISVTLIVVAVPEGLPLAVTLALAFATKRMTQEKLLVRVLGSCETMANASVVCTDKTGTLTQNAMTVVAGSVGIYAKFVQKLEDNQARTNADEQTGVKEMDGAVKRKHTNDFSIDQSQLNSVLNVALRKLFNEAIAVNSTAFEDTDQLTGQREFVGSKTETALLSFAKELGWADYQKTREEADIVQMIPFSSERKAMGVVVKLPNGKWRLYLKGASEVLAKKCVSHVVVGRPGESVKDSEDSEVETKPIDDLAKDNISRTIIFYANQTLRTIALCYKNLDRWPPSEKYGPDEVPYDDLATDMVLIGITGIEDPLRPGVREAVANCVKAGVQVKMCTGDNVLTARSIALQCGIFTPGGIIIEGPVFRQLNDQDMLEIVPRLQVLARSSPEDKKILVEKLKSLGEIVGVTGDGTNDGPALKTAHVGFSMGIAGTEVAKEASDIILMDDNFASIVKAIMWGRCVNDAVRKFLQFQISVNITAVIVTFISAVASEDEEAVLTAVQLLWINIIMDTFAALALATDPATPVLLDRKPDRQTAPLFSVDMYKQIFGQSAYQTTMILIFHFLGNRIFGYQSDPNDESVGLHNKAVLNTLVFNAFVFAQIFNSINSRRIDRHKNVFQGILKNYYFMIITAIEVGIQILIMFVGGHAFQVTRIPGREWGISLALGFMSLPIGFLIRCVPNDHIEPFFKKMGLLKESSELPTTSPEASDWNPAIKLVQEKLSMFSKIRGGRLRASSFVVKSRTTRMKEADVRLPSLMTMIPTIVATSVGAGWSPQQGSLSDPTKNDPSRSSAALMEGKVQIHPDTPKDDPAYKKWGGSRSHEALP